MLTMVNNRTNYARDISAMVRESYGSRVKIFANSIPESVRAAEISAEGISIFKHDPKGKVAMAYLSLTEEVIGIECESDLQSEAIEVAVHQRTVENGGTE